MDSVAPGEDGSAVSAALCGLVAWANEPGVGGAALLLLAGQFRDQSHVVARPSPLLALPLPECGFPLLFGPGLALKGGRRFGPAAAASVLPWCPSGVVGRPPLSDLLGNRPVHTHCSKNHGLLSGRAPETSKQVHPGTLLTEDS